MRLLVIGILLLPVAALAETADEVTIAASIDSLEAVQSQLELELSAVKELLGELRVELARLEALGDSLEPGAVRLVKDAKLRVDPYVYGEVQRIVPGGTGVLVTAYAGDQYWEVLVEGDVGYMSDVYFVRTPEMERMFTEFEEGGGVGYRARKAAERARAKDQAKAKARADLEALANSIPAQGSRLVTMDAYRGLKTGMNYIDACATIGFWGTEITRSDLAGYTTVMYAWQNPGGSNMNAMFQNGQLVSKAQFGLR